MQKGDIEILLMTNKIYSDGIKNAPFYLLLILAIIIILVISYYQSH